MSARKRGQKKGQILIDCNPKSIYYLSWFMQDEQMLLAGPFYAH